MRRYSRLHPPDRRRRALRAVGYLAEACIRRVREDGKRSVHPIGAELSRQAACAVAPNTNLNAPNPLHPSRRTLDSLVGSSDLLGGLFPMTFQQLTSFQVVSQDSQFLATAFSGTPDPPESSQEACKWIELVSSAFKTNARCGSHKST
jgi:hypothetical protein